MNDALVEEYWRNELVGHISRDATAINGREKAVKKEKQVKAPWNRGRLAKREDRAPLELKRLDIQLRSRRQTRLLLICRKCVTVERKRMPKGTRRAGLAINFMLMSMMLGSL